MSEKIIYNMVLRGKCNFEKIVSVIGKDEEEAAEIAEKALVKSLTSQNFYDINVDEIFCDELDEQNAK